MLSFSEIIRLQFQLCNVVTIAYKHKKFLTQTNQLNHSFKEQPFAVQGLFSRGLSQLHQTKFNQLSIVADEVGHSSPQSCELSQLAVPLGFCYCPPASHGMRTTGKPCYKDIISDKDGRSSTSSHCEPVRSRRVVTANSLLMATSVPFPCCTALLLYLEGTAFNLVYDPFCTVTLQRAVLPQSEGQKSAVVVREEFLPPALLPQRLHPSHASL